MAVVEKDGMDFTQSDWLAKSKERAFLRARSGKLQCYFTSIIRRVWVNDPACIFAK